MKKLLFIFVLVLLIPLGAAAQGSAFNFQGRLNDGTNPANGSYDLQFRLYNAIAGGAQIGAVSARPNTTLINGVFSVSLDFGATAFNNPNAVFIEISVKPNGSPNAYTILGPRQQLTVVPYAVRAANAATAENALSLGGLPANQYATTSDSINFIRNTTTAQTGNFNISGNGTVGNLGIGTSAGTSKLEIAAQDGLRITGFQPFMTFRDTNNSNLRSRLQANDGGFSFYPDSSFGGNPPVVISNSGFVGIGTISPTAKLHVVGTTRSNILEITGGSDLAEKFEFSETVKPGMVVAIDPNNDGKLTLARGAYNRQVAGIVSGANNLSAGMVLPNVKDAANAMPVALSGRVWVYADAAGNPIAPGDLMTTANTPGFAMKVINHKKAQGAIIGKAMTELKSGTGLVLVLVTLQ